MKHKHCEWKSTVELGTRNPKTPFALKVNECKEFVKNYSY